MARTIALAALLAAAGSSTALAQPATTEIDVVDTYKAIDRTTQTEDIQLQSDQYERMTVPVRLAGSGPYRFLVDTGADRTAISHQLASGLKLRAGASLSLHSVTGVSKVTSVMVPSLQLTRKDMKVDDAPLLDARDIGADGILGVDSLKSQRVTFDFENETMSIVPSGAARQQPIDPNTIVVTAKAKRGRLIVTRAVANGARATVILDTGSQITIGNSALRKALGGSGQIAGARPVELQSVTGGTISGEAMTIRKLTVGGVVLTDLVIVFADAHTFRQLDLSRKPALLLGMNAMRAFRKVSIDFAERKMRVLLPEQSSLPVRLALR